MNVRESPWQAPITTVSLSHNDMNSLQHADFTRSVVALNFREITMIDFKKLAEDHYNNATPEERERIDAYEAREAKLDVTRRDITATFTDFTERFVNQGAGKKPKYELHPLKVTSRTIEMRIEDRTDSNDKPYEVIQFIGHQAYQICEDFIEGLTRPAETDEEDIFSICWGSAKYARGDVSKSAVADYLREVRPELFMDHPAPTL